MLGHRGDRTTRELREKLVRLANEQSDSAKRQIREIRTSILKSTRDAIKDLDLRGQAERATEELYQKHMDQVAKMVAVKQKEMLS